MPCEILSIIFICLFLTKIWCLIEKEAKSQRVVLSSKKCLLQFCEDGIKIKMPYEILPKVFTYLFLTKFWCLIEKEAKSQRVVFSSKKCLQQFSGILELRCLTHCLGINYYVNFLGGIGSNGFHIKWIFGTQGNWKNQNPGGRFGATS